MLTTKHLHKRVFRLILFLIPLNLNLSEWSRHRTYLSFPMKSLFIPLVLTFFCLNSPLFAQVELCQGAYFTEAQGKEFLQKNEVKTLAEW